jgi:hypothetical protein
MKFHELRIDLSTEVAPGCVDGVRRIEERNPRL